MRPSIWTRMAISLLPIEDGEVAFAEQMTEGFLYCNTASVSAVSVVSTGAAPFPATAW